MLGIGLVIGREEEEEEGNFSFHIQRGIETERLLAARVDTADEEISTWLHYDLVTISLSLSLSVSVSISVPSVKFELASLTGERISSSVQDFLFVISIRIYGSGVCH